MFHPAARLCASGNDPAPSRSTPSAIFPDFPDLPVLQTEHQAIVVVVADSRFGARHVAVIGRGQSEDLIDTWLRAEGIERNIALVVSGYIQALHVAARTDLVAFVPLRLITALSKQLSLVSVTPPLDPGIDEQFMFYPTRAQMDHGSIWLRRLMLETRRELDRDKRKAA
jgi:DNA-binding transcriptional LysR family regulator